ncbi:MAG TPA: polyphosphate kinase 1 [Bacteroidales bacterium]|jgi:polyphosphate kinase|nr:polyphosphate kinase 1 [Bacteroidales bacterium]OQB64968.1 MAG: Polyphosphate kinase [Bacteroidetes bacterium ADurb.Bin145]HOU01630.1 polyphosphate kinase 1 [Bacteroidales bacterium]HQG62824.1 polyphosphate kinase 1 [Bacteroidales bacterium]HQK66926.1 polyphosphate kinase 1 [Bacteroidales bacterium]
MSRTYIPKEISWLSFNERVLQEAENKEVPLIERFKFLGIYSNNLDEYFRVRVATLKRLSHLGNKSKDVLGYSPKATLKKIQKIVLEQNTKFEKIYTMLIQELAKHNIHIINEKQLNHEQSEFVRSYFHSEVRTRLMPFLLEKDKEMPNLTDDAIYLAIILKKKDSDKTRYALIEVPTNILPRLIILPDSETGRNLIYLDDIIRFGLKDIFFIFDFDEFSAYTIKLTKDAELEIADDISESYIEKLSKSLHQRKWGSPVRFIYDRKMPADLLNILTKKLNFGPDDVIIPADRYHNLKDLMHIPSLGKKKFYYEPLVPINHKDIQAGKSILSAIKKKDIMLFFPYHPFDYLIDLLREASIDPFVTSIQITLYRLARNSSVINALLNAVMNGKKVTTVVELQARFDEEANILWGNKLMDAGVKVIYGVPGLKVHAKLLLITKVKNDVIQRYAAIGTGNFNEDTARVYTDHLLLTTDIKITNEVFKAFSFFNVNYKKDNYYHLVLSPFALRNKINLLIDNEIKNAKAGKKAYIYLKLNNISDTEIIDRLYEASSAGVNIKMIIRGMMSLVPGLKDISENIKAIGIVDRLLEHSRFMIFCNGGDEECFISSADLMTRNIDHRIEVTCPVFDKNIKNELKEIFQIQWNDNVKARKLDSTLSNKFVKPGKKEHRSQLDVYNYLKKIHEK